VRRTDPGLTVRWHAGAFNNGLILGATYHSVSRLPRRCSYGIGHVCMWLAHRLMRDGTRSVIENLRVVCPDAPESELRRLALLMYRSYACDTIDFIRGLSLDRAHFEPMVAQLDSERFDDLLAEGRGVILVGGHFGNWELGGIALRLLRGYSLTVVGRPEPSPAVSELRRQMRDSLGIETIEIGRMLDTALQIRRALNANGVVAMLLDRHLGRDRVEVEFFGRRTPFLRTPAMIGYLAAAPLLPSFMIRLEDGRFTGVCGAPIRVDTSLPPEESVRRATQAFAGELERRIRAFPHLWYQFYPYFSPES
jgi:KDO2-lipid IV(A) lauroyltransferase